MARQEPRRLAPGCRLLTDIVREQERERENIANILEGWETGKKWGSSRGRSGKMPPGYTPQSSLSTNSKSSCSASGRPNYGERWRYGERIS